MAQPGYYIYFFFNIITMMINIKFNVARYTGFGKGLSKEDYNEYEQDLKILKDYLAR